ncbi:hypothetical protein SAMN04488118_102512 [Epibacterium ulvae]|uniref:DUF4412 domain-containing protein n=1 Tax=Epibacterium ulvae TaxID=1156985 RepID=A0A1G5Q2V2_9RHOB|nr:hypothetical protein [Epibacterium ulvae]SCZ55997.1 hypothetical protein SAMN04488118_102512 [Epibacterium ulvae]
MLWLSPSKSKTLFVAATSLCIAASTAYAACPTKDSLSHGVFVTYDDDSYTRFTAKEDGVIFEDTNYMDGSGFRVAYVLQQGLLSTMSFEFEDAQVKPVSVEQTSFSGGRLDIDRMKEKAETHLKFERTDRKGTTNGSMIITKGKRITETIGGCRYKVHPVSLAETTSQGTRTTHLLYIPELGVSVLNTIIQRNGQFAEFAVKKMDDDFPWEGRD